MSNTLTNSTSFMALHGATLVDNGYRIVPIKPSDKAPGRYDAISNQWLDATEWSRFCDRAPTDLEITNWEGWPGSGVGIACGNVVGIDIDILDVGMATRIEELAREILGETEAIRFGQRPKRMLVYRCEEPFDSFDIRPLQVYAKGRQFVAFGIHPVTQRPYEWAFRSLTEVDRSDLPVITEQKAREWGEAAAKLMGVATPRPNNGQSHHAHEAATYEAVQQALQFIPSDASTSRAEWIEIGMAIKSGLGDDGRILWHEWSAQDDRYNSKECDKQFDSFKNDRANAIGVGTLYERARLRGWVPNGVDLYARDAEVRHAQIHIDIAAILESCARRQGIRPASEEVIYTVPQGEPGWLRDLGGGLRLFVEHANDTAIRPQPWVTLGGALAMFGALAGRRYASPTNLRTNLYCIGIADSGGGKNHPLRLVSTLLKEAGLNRFLGGENIASGAGLVSAVTAQPSIIFPIDEIGFLINAAADRKKSPKHLTEILDRLTQFYSTAAHTFLGTEYANKKERARELIEQPCMCLYGLTTPSVFWSSLSSDNVMDGSLARMLIFESENNYPDARHDIEWGELPSHLIEAVQAVAEGAAGHVALPLGDLAINIPQPFRVPYADEKAKQLAIDIDHETTRELRKYMGTPMTSVIARQAENAVKVALVRAIANNPAKPAIDFKDLSWGYDIAKQSVDTIVKAVNERVANNEAEATLKKVLKIINDAGSSGIDKGALTRRTQWLRDTRHRDGIIDQLIEGGQIWVGKAGLDPSRPKTVFYAS